LSISKLPNLDTKPAFDTSKSWHAELALGFEKRHDKTILASRRQRGPLSIQRPFYPENDVCHAYVLHPPGGVVGGDQLTIDINTAANANALLTTPGATKFYRSNGAQAIQLQKFSVANGCMEWLPQENIFFPGANCSLTTEIHLDESAQYIGWEIQCLGRPAISEIFNHGNLKFKTAVYRDGKPLFLDRFIINNIKDLKGAAGLRGLPVFATMLATIDARTVNYATSNSALSDQILKIVRPFCKGDKISGEAGVTLINNVLVIRYLGSSTAEAHRLLRNIWLEIRPLINQHKAVAPRIWAT